MVATERIAVIGAGLMGHGLAQVFAQAGHQVAIHDPQPATLDSVHERVEQNMVALGGVPPFANVIERIRTFSDIAECVADADFVIEAVPEDLQLKRALFDRLQDLASGRAILATNTSVMPVGDVSAMVRDASRVVGTHWWNPPYVVPLVEVVQAVRTSEQTVSRTIDLLQRAGKQPVHVRRDIPGFVGNRLQHALWREAIALVADGVCDADTVDQVVILSFGPRLAVMGPLETAELVGLDMTLSIHEHVLADLNRDRNPSALLRDLVDRGDLGMKTGRGFRDWPPDAVDQARRMLLRHLAPPGGTPA
jgi:3-hydroxybutyryl-CoA dehydrogenase